ALQARAQRERAREPGVRHARRARASRAVRDRRQAATHASVPRQAIEEGLRVSGEVKHVLVIGAGTMGAGIAEVCAKSGIETTLSDVTVDFVDRGVSKIEASLAK